VPVPSAVAEQPATEVILLPTLERALTFY